MIKEKLLFFFVLLLLSYIALFSFQASPYIVVTGLIAYFVFMTKKDKDLLDTKLNRENKELLKEVKSTAENAYLKHKQLLTMVTNIPMPLLLLDEHGDIVLYNKAFSIIRVEGEVEKLDYINSGSEGEAARFIKDSFIFERSLDEIISIKGKTYNAICVPVTTNSKFSGCVVLFQDISEAKEREVMQKQFIADASHELKTPVSVIKGMVEILNREDFEDEKTRKEFLLQIEKEGNRLEYIIRDLLQLSKLSVNNLIVSKQSVTFTPTIKNCVNTFALQAKEKGIQIKCVLNDDEIVEIDVNLFTTLLNNLISNAIKYSDGGTITIMSEKTEEGRVVSIQDQGVGLSQEDCQKVFERFYRVDKARSRNSGGSGLGLSIVKSIVEALDAQISLESALGKGTMVKIIFKDSLSS